LATKRNKLLFLIFNYNNKSRGGTLGPAYFKKEKPVNQYYNYKKWLLEKNKKVRLATFPKIEWEDDKSYIHPQTEEEKSERFGPSSSHITHNEVPLGHSIRVSPPYEHRPYYQILMNNAYGAETSENAPKLSIRVNPDLKNKALDALHYLFKSHPNFKYNDNISVLQEPTIFYSDTGEENYRDGEDQPIISSYKSAFGPGNDTDISAHTTYDTEDHLAEGLQHIFSSFLLHELKDLPSNHPIRDYLQDANSLHSRGPEDKHIPIKKEEDPYAESIVRGYIPIIRKYIEHIMTSNKPQTLDTFLGSEENPSKDHSFNSLLGDILHGTDKSRQEEDLRRLEKQNRVREEIKLKQEQQEQQERKIKAENDAFLRKRAAETARKIRRKGEAR